MGEHAYDYNSSMSPSTPPAPHSGSSRHHTTVQSSRTTTRPAIKIIHIIAPEIIKTDAANFRDLVQRLTGRKQPAAIDDEDSTAVTVAVAPTHTFACRGEAAEEEVGAGGAERGFPWCSSENRRRKKIKCEVVKVEEGGFGFGGAGDLDFGELWMDLNPGEFFSFLEEDVFQGMAPDFLKPPRLWRRREWI